MMSENLLSIALVSTTLLFLIYWKLNYIIEGAREFDEVLAIGCGHYGQALMIELILSTF